MGLHPVEHSVSWLEHVAEEDGSPDSGQEQRKSKGHGNTRCSALPLPSIWAPHGPFFHWVEMTYPESSSQQAPGSPALVLRPRVIGIEIKYRTPTGQSVTRESWSVGTDDSVLSFQPFGRGAMRECFRT